jgi:hypothetical protein
MDDYRDGPEWGYCQKDDCKEPAIPCWMPDSDYGVDDPDDLLCAEHCQEEGYCWGCGYFWAGIESFDFRANGLCDNCKDEYADPDDYDDEIDYMWDLP